jgi:hypothetical protein
MRLFGGGAVKMELFLFYWRKKLKRNLINQ